jgi:ribonuclease BN (tRNA processing enzyme)
MCDYVSQAVSRRGFLQRAGALGAAAGIGGMGQIVDAPAATRSGTRLALLGTAGGPGWMTPERSGISSAVLVADAVYLVDCGEGFGPRLMQVLDSPRVTLAAVRALFVTHLHSDHTIDYVNLPVVGMWNGRNDPSRKLRVFGPGERGGLTPVFPPSRTIPALVNPQDPTPGITRMTEYIYKAYATDLNDRLRDSGGTDPRSVLVPSDIELPAGVPWPVDANPMPTVDPFPIFEDDRVRVTATLVNHAPVFPSFAFRFDTDDGSLTFSGDTAPCDNLVTLATGTDVLVHEVIDADWVNAQLPPPRTPEDEALVGHLLGSHTTIEQVGPVAERAGAHTLVLNHFVPANNPRRRWMAARRGFSGRLIVGEDLLQLGVRQSDSTSPSRTA